MLADVKIGRAKSGWLEPSLTSQETWDIMVSSFEMYLAAGQPEKALGAIGFEVGISAALKGVIAPLERALGIPEPGSIEQAWIKLGTRSRGTLSFSILRGLGYYSVK